MQRPACMPLAYDHACSSCPLCFWRSSASSTGESVIIASSCREGKGEGKLGGVNPGSGSCVVCSRADDPCSGARRRDAAVTGAPQSQLLSCSCCIKAPFQLFRVAVHVVLASGLTGGDLFKVRAKKASKLQQTFYASSELAVPYILFFLQQAKGGDLQ